MHNSNILVGILILLIVLVINVLLIMVIWNEVIIKKLPGDIKKLNFWDALALGVFFSILSGWTDFEQHHFNN